MNVRISAKRPLSALLAFLLVTGSPIADESNTIISEWNAAIQLIYTSTFDDWPGVSGIAPVDVSAAAGRVWLVWPESLINLDGNGMADEQTLLTMFASRTARWAGGKWTPENGVVCSDGYWRGFVDLPRALVQLDPLSGEVLMADWEGDLPDSIHPAADGNLLIFTGGEARLAGFECGEYGRAMNKRLSADIPPVSMLAVSSELALAAWKDTESDGIHIADLSGGHKIIPLEPEILPALAPWSMDWAGGMLVLAYPGQLYALDLLSEGIHRIFRLEDARLPNRWYRLRGGTDRLVIQSPEPGIIAIVTPGAAERDIKRNIGSHDFAGVLKEYALSAGDKLEDLKLYREAEGYYGWILPYIRNQRSRHPLEEQWPNLESAITGRRSVLRDRFN